ncbi:hypothetical protein CH063_14622 [Colletotrichum higginsianum]|uniref:Uncharacterized protein n=1 Tax=Colletotrichum higginsianum (strain IMI 349063) TaxID=759273 RepID=H1VZC2_COLHI|nr:hypothetical protein CH063_14622 [Colletotrichum higginsianum]
MESEKSFCHCSRNSHLQTPNLLAFTTPGTLPGQKGRAGLALSTESLPLRASGRKGNRAHRRIRMLGSCGSLVHISGDKSHYGTDIPAFNMCSKFVEGVGMGPTFARFRHDDGDRAW